MARTLKSETQIKNQMISYITQYGMDTNTKITDTDGTHLQIIAPNRFGPGYIQIVLTNGDVWSADFSTRKPGSITPPRKQHPNVLLCPYGAA